MIILGCFSLVLHKNLCCGYLFEAFLKSTCLTCFYGEIIKNTPGPSCSKLMMSLVNSLFKFTSSDMQICCYFLLKKFE